MLNIGDNSFDSNDVYARANTVERNSPTYISAEKIQYIKSQLNYFLFFIE